LPGQNLITITAIATAAAAATLRAQQLENSIAVYVGPYGGYLEQLSSETSTSNNLAEGTAGESPVEEKKPVRCKLPQDLHADVELITADAVQYCIELSSAGNTAVHVVLLECRGRHHAVHCRKVVCSIVALSCSVHHRWTLYE
jgi:hypothetical protein